MNLPNWKLYDFGLAFYPSRTRLLLIEKYPNLFPSSIINIKLMAFENLEPEYLKFNRNGSVPTLIVNQGLADEKILIESLDICKYMNSWDGKPLGSSDSNYKESEVKEWVDVLEKWNGNVFSDGYNSTSAILKKITNLKKSFLEKRLKQQKDEEMKQIYQEKINSFEKVQTEADFVENRNQLKEILLKAESKLSEDRPFLIGSSYTMADVFLTSILQRVKQVGKLDEYLETFPNVKRWFMTSIQTRPSYEQAFSHSTMQRCPAILLVDVVPKFIQNFFGVL